MDQIRHFSQGNRILPNRIFTLKTKLTFLVDQKIVQNAKVYANQNSQSLSSLIENFLANLIKKNARHSVVDASRGLLKERYGCLSDGEIRKEHHQKNNPL